MQKRNTLTALACLLGLAALHAPVLAQNWPTRPIKLVVPFPPGGLIDNMARLVAPKLSQELGQPIVIDNKPGAGGNLGAGEASRAAPDGYTLLMASPPLTINPALYKKLPYEPRSIAPIGLLGRVPNVLVVNPASGIQNVADLTGRMKARPGQLNYASNGNGTSLHLSAELYKSLAGTYVTHIPYRGAGPALNDTVAGQVPVIFDNLPSALPFIKDNRLVPIVVAAPQRLSVLPNIPTFKDVGLEPVNRMAYYGILGPKNLPKEVVDKISGGVKKALEDPAVRKRIEDTGSLIVANTPEQFAAQIKAEFEIYKKVVDDQKLKLD